MALIPGYMHKFLTENRSTIYLGASFLKSITVKSPIAKILYADHKIDEAVLQECNRIIEITSTAVEISGPYKFSHLRYTVDALICWFRSTDNKGNLFPDDFTDSNSDEFYDSIKKTQSVFNELIQLQDDFANIDGTADALEKYTARLELLKKNKKNFKEMNDYIKRNYENSGIKLDIEDDKGNIIKIEIPKQDCLETINGHLPQTEIYTVKLNDSNVQLTGRVKLDDGMYLKIDSIYLKQIIQFITGCTARYQLVDKSKICKFIDIQFEKFELKKSNFEN